MAVPSKNGVLKSGSFVIFIHSVTVSPERSNHKKPPLTLDLPAEINLISKNFKKRAI